MPRPSRSENRSKARKIGCMRPDERLDAGLRDPYDLRPLLLASSHSELAFMRRLADERGERLSIDLLANRLAQLIAKGVPGPEDAPPLYRLSAWAAGKLGGHGGAHGLDDADEQI